jgi:putative acetyltransferase
MKKKIREFRKLLRKFDRINELLNMTCCKSVTVAQCHVLLEIEELGNATTVKLSENLRLDRSTLSRTIDALVKKGLVNRIEDQEDRRYTILTLSDLGKETCSEINMENDLAFQKVFGSTNAEQFNEIVTNFKILTNSMIKYYVNINNKCNNCD